MDRNPFHHVRKLEKFEEFYNRDSQVRNALRLLRQLQNVEVIGPRRIGKTWFLRYISHPDTLKKYGIDPRCLVFVYIDCQRGHIQQDAPLVYKGMLQAVVRAARRSGVDIVSGLGDEPRPGMAFEQALGGLSYRGLTTVLLLDEFEAMAQNSRLEHDFFSNLRGLCGAADLNVAYVTASCTSLADLCLERRSLLSSPFFNIFRIMRLGLFSERDSRHLIDDSLRRAETRFPRELAELVLEVGGGHPFFLQMSGYHAFDLLDEGAKLTEVKRREFLKAITTEATGHFRYYWKNLNGHERYILAALPSLWRDPSYQEAISCLEERCLIIRRNGGYDYFSPLFEAFVRRQNVNGLLKGGPLLIDRGRQQVLLRGKHLDLSPISYSLLACLMEKAGQVVTNEELRRAAWPQERHNAVEQFSVETVVRLVQEAMLGEIARQKYLVYLRQLLVDRFSDGELRTLCFDLGVDFHDLPGEGTPDKARELVSYLHRHQLVPKMARVGAETRPDIPWVSQSGVTETAPSTSRSPWHERLGASMGSLCDALGDAADCIVKHGEVGYMFRLGPPLSTKI